jgi:restriction system-associated AAA family ATPase
MKLKELELYTRFRGLAEDFYIRFDRPVSNAFSKEVQPICLVGLNGSGKSNLLQVLANIFYYLEGYVLGKDRFTEHQSGNALNFRIHYQMPVTPNTHLSYINAKDERKYEDETNRTRDSQLRSVIITRRGNGDPVFEFYYNDESEKVVFGRNDIERSMLGRLLPNRVVGYSSGNNEILSNPFTKMDFFYLDELRRKTAEKMDVVANMPVQHSVASSEESGLTVNRLFYLDYHSNAMMVIANFLMKRNVEGGATAELDIINQIIGVDDLLSFRIRVRLLIRTQITFEELLANMSSGLSEKEQFEVLLSMREIDIPHELDETLHALVKCATAVNFLSVPGNSDREASYELHYCVDHELKKAFQDHFKGQKGALYLFERLYLLNLLNIENYSEKLRGKIMTSGSTDDIYDLLPKLPAEERVFHIDNIKLRKNSGAEIYYKQLSDGEHQYLQVAGSLMLMDENATLFLLDEPETHFNPEWRSQLISTLNKIRDCKKEQETESDRQSFELVQDILLTTHSPFILSDSEHENIYTFSRDTSGQVKWAKPDSRTYGTSVNAIMEQVLEKKETISAMPLAEIARLKADADTLEGIQRAKNACRRLGDSKEKVMFFHYLIEQEKKIKKSAAGK